MNQYIDKHITTGTLLSNGWYAEFYTVFITYPDKLQQETAFQIKNSIRTDAYIIDIFDNEEFIYKYFNNLIEYEPLTDVLVDDDLALLKTAWEEHLILKRSISNTLKNYYENTNFRCNG